MQKRSKSGTDFENQVCGKGWRRKTSSPKLKWTGKGKSVFDKMKYWEYNPKEFNLYDSSKFCKYDIVSEDGEYREVKKYYMEKLNNWTLYSEPYFKVATKKDATRIDVDTYNKFVDNFYEYNVGTGLFDYVVENMIKCISGIQVKDGFIPKDKLEFRTVIADGWRGYNRITIQVRIK